MLSASTVSRLKEASAEEHAHRSERDLSAKRYVSSGVDGVHVQARLEDAAQCLLVVIGATPPEGEELVGLNDGVRASAQSWREFLLDLKRRGLAMRPELAVADGALGFWQAVEEVWPQTRRQRCWVHKTANVLNQLPKSQQSKAKRALQEVSMAETKSDALMAFNAFVENWGIQYDKAVDCLIKDRDTLLAFYDFPAEHSKHCARRMRSDGVFLCAICCTASAPVTASAKSRARGYQYDRTAFIVAPHSPHPCAASGLPLPSADGLFVGMFSVRATSIPDPLPLLSPAGVDLWLTAGIKAGVDLKVGRTLDPLR